MTAFTALAAPPEGVPPEPRAVAHPPVRQLEEDGTARPDARVHVAIVVCMVLAGVIAVGVAVALAVHGMG